MSPPCRPVSPPCHPVSPACHPVSPACHRVTRGLVFHCLGPHETTVDRGSTVVYFIFGTTAKYPVVPKIKFRRQSEGAGIYIYVLFIYVFCSVGVKRLFIITVIVITGFFSKNILCFCRLVLKGMYHCWTCFCPRGANANGRVAVDVEELFCWEPFAMFRHPRASSFTGLP